MIKRIGNYLNNNSYKMIVDENSIYVANYKSLRNLEDDYIAFKTSNKLITVTGTNLTLKKIVDDELLIKGKIKKIEVFDE